MNKNKIKKILALGSMASVLALTGGGPALASFEAINDTTGFNSVNNVAVSATDAYVNAEVNLETVGNIGTGSVTTGGNIVENNTTDGFAETGYIGVDGMFLNELNVNTSSYAQSFLSDALSQNSTTGAESENNADTVLNESFAAVGTNTSVVGNSTEAQAVSGNNLVSNNTGYAFLGTGDIEGMLGTENMLNSNFLEVVSSGGDLAEAINDTTGFDSLNNASIAVDSTVSATNTNSADIENSIFALMSSGGNIVSGNTDPEVTTGNVMSDVSVNNMDVNSNDTTIVLDAAGSGISSGNFTTGSDSTNNASASVTESATVVNTNSASIGNGVSTTATSGGNNVSNNTGFATLSTGSAGNSVSIENAGVNSNSTDVSLGTGGVSVSASNDTTGSGSENNADAMLDESAVVTNTNTAAIENVVEATANTGGNVVSNNTGSADVSTGDSSTGTSIVNSVNTNSTSVAVSPVTDVMAGNSTTGANSTNNASSVASESVAVTNTNEANIANVVSLSSNTGGNDVSGNTQGGSVASGSSSLTFGVENSGNSNTTTVGE